MPRGNGKQPFWDTYRHDTTLDVSVASYMAPGYIVIPIIHINISDGSTLPVNCALMSLDTILWYDRKGYYDRKQ